ncbi:DNA/RNA non-specific endonuclease [Gilvibacter sediminis]|uniref:DNA/RNA non-specific endonuclease n=1 Tax=Gilvibacter sediminis TaxID=379071 RepID=UPI0023501D56|nr:DNA/RNA non-specific endonuclease [Gilvibacter sediminis]MDC7997409.1 DNA/RNA non-specific endonuclease [Gilvibacter sediminis]
MSRKYVYPILIVVVTIALYYLEDYIDNNPVGTTEVSVDSSSDTFGATLFPAGDALVSRDYYTLSYNETHEQANWVAYTLREEQVVNNDFDRPYFEQDPKVKSKSAHWRNYKNSGYDRGHLVAAADMEFSYDAFKDTFYTSNISPQLHDFNSGVWNYLEQRVRRWAKENDDVFVITGGVLKNPMDAIGSEQVSVPNAFYKIVVDSYRGEYRVIAFLIPHREDITRYSDYIVSVDEIEQATGIDFFAKLPSSQQKELQSRIDRLYYDID